MAYVGLEVLPEPSRILSEGELSFSSNNITVPGGFKPGTLNVHINGIRLQKNDYDDSSGSQIDLLESYPAGTSYSIEEYRTFPVGDLTQSDLTSSKTGQSGSSVVGYDNTTSGLETPIEIQAALDEAVDNQLGWSTSWQSFLGTKTQGVTYTNTTGRPLSLHAWASRNAYSMTSIYVNDLLVAISQIANQDGMQPRPFVCAVVPDGSTYRVETVGGLEGWLELI